MFFDPLYFIVLAPGLLLALWAQWRVQTAFSEGKMIASSSGLTGAQAAAEVLRSAGISGVAIEPVEGTLSDHYDPRDKVLRLSPDVYQGRSLSALGVAAHEAGHAIQDASHYPLMGIRSGLVPLASVGSNVSWILIVIGISLMGMRSILGQPIVLLGILAFSLTVLFQLINLPVEFDASRRAREMLTRNGLITAQEDAVVGHVLSAAAMTYVAATITAILTLVYYLIRAGLLGGRRND